MAIYGAVLAITIWHVYAVPMPEGYDRPTELWIWYLMAFALLSAARLVWHFAIRSEPRWIESALLTVMTTAMVLDAISNWMPDLHLREGNLLATAPFLLLAKTAAFLARNFRLFQSQGALNAMLQAKVAQREADPLKVQPGQGQHCGACDRNHR